MAVTGTAVTAVRKCGLTNSLNQTAGLAEKSVYNLLLHMQQKIAG